MSEKDVVVIVATTIEQGANVTAKLTVITSDMLSALRVGVDGGKKIESGMTTMPNEYCRWCQRPSGKTDIGFSVVDDDFGQYVKEPMIKFCPFCGRKLRERED